MRDRFDELRAASLDVLVILCQNRDAVSRWLVKHPLPFPVLIDDDRTNARRWGVYVALSYDSMRIAKPATFVIDRCGIVRYARIAKHQLDPAPIPEIVSALG